MDNREGNGLGTAGFIVSLVGILSCGLISPVGMVMSAVAMKREPKGLAVAGFVIGLLGSLWMIPLFAFGLLGVILAAVGLGAAVAQAGNIEAAFELASLSNNVQAHVDQNGSPPATLAELSLDQDALTDPWGAPYRYTLDSVGGWSLTSDGEDGIPGTADDVDSND